MAKAFSGIGRCEGGSGIVTEASKQKRRSDSSRRKLIETAIAVLAREGFRGATIVRIQEEAGLSRGLISYHFNSKDNLIEACVDHIRDRYIEEQKSRAVRGSSGLDECLMMIDHLLERLATDPTVAKVMLVLATESLGDHPGV